MNINQLKQDVIDYAHSIGIQHQGPYNFGGIPKSG